MILNVTVVLAYGMLNSKLVYTYYIIYLSLLSIYDKVAHSFSHALRLLAAHAVFFSVLL